MNIERKKDRRTCKYQEKDKRETERGRWGTIEADTETTKDRESERERQKEHMR